MKLSTNLTRVISAAFTLCFLTGCATTSHNARLPLEPDSRWALATPTKEEAPVNSVSRCFFRRIVTVPMKTSLEVCARPSEESLRNAGRLAHIDKPSDTAYDAGSVFIPILKQAAAPKPERVMKIASVNGVVPPTEPSKTAAADVIADLRAPVPTMEYQGPHLHQITASASY